MTKTTVQTKIGVTKAQIHQYCDLLLQENGLLREQIYLYEDIALHVQVLRREVAERMLEQEREIRPLLKLVRGVRRFIDWVKKSVAGAKRRVHRAYLVRHEARRS